jgi:hypothetical protein
MYCTAHHVSIVIIDFLGAMSMTLSGVVAYLVILGGMWALATGLMFGLRAVKLI